MDRGIITNNGHGISISNGDIWMTTWEIADLLYTTTCTINKSIKAIMKSNIFNKSEVYQYIKLENGNSADAYNLDMVIALSYRISTGHSVIFRKWLTSKVAHKQECSIPVFINWRIGNAYHC